MSAQGLHISISAEEIFSLGGFSISNSIFTSMLVSGTIILFALLVNRSIKQTNRPRGLQNFAEMLVEGFDNLVHSVTSNHKKTALFLPIIMSFFLFILLNNWSGLLPGMGTIGMNVIETDSEKHVQHWQFAPAVVNLPAPQTAYAANTLDSINLEKPTTNADDRAIQNDAHESGEKTDSTDLDSTHQKYVPYFRAGTADLNGTIALGLISVFLVQFFGVKYLGLNYFSKFFNFSNPINFFVGLLELVSEFSKILSFAFRLFGNVFAGEVLLAVIGFIAGLIAPIPFYGLELFVGLIQALVFSMLSVVLFNMATIGHGDH